MVLELPPDLDVTPRYRGSHSIVDYRLTGTVVDFGHDSYQNSSQYPWLSPSQYSLKLHNHGLKHHSFIHCLLFLVPECQAWRTGPRIRSTLCCSKTIPQHFLLSSVPAGIHNEPFGRVGRQIPDSHHHISCKRGKTPLYDFYSSVLL